MSKKDAKVTGKLLLKVTISGGREIIIWGIPDYDSVINGKWNVLNNRLIAKIFCWATKNFRNKKSVICPLSQSEKKNKMDKKTCSKFQSI